MKDVKINLEEMLGNLKMPDITIGSKTYSFKNSVLTDIDFAFLIQMRDLVNEIGFENAAEIFPYLYHLSEEDLKLLE